MHNRKHSKASSRQIHLRLNDFRSDRLETPDLKTELLLQHPLQTHQHGISDLRIAFGAFVAKWQNTKQSTFRITFEWRFEIFDIEQIWRYLYGSGSNCIKTFSWYSKLYWKRELLDWWVITKLIKLRLWLYIWAFFINPIEER